MIVVGPFQLRCSVLFHSIPFPYNISFLPYYILQYPFLLRWFCPASHRSGSKYKRQGGRRVGLCYPPTYLVPPKPRLQHSNTCSAAADPLTAHKSTDYLIPCNSLSRSRWLLDQFLSTTGVCRLHPFWSHPQSDMLNPGLQQLKKRN